MTVLVHPAAKTNVTSDLLHDLRTPLNQIIGYSDMLCEEAGAETEGLSGDLGKIRDAGYRMLTLIEENFTAVAERGASASVQRHPGRAVSDSFVAAAPAVAAPRWRSALRPA